MKSIAAALLLLLPFLARLFASTVEGLQSAFTDFKDFFPQPEYSDVVALQEELIQIIDNAKMFIPESQMAYPYYRPYRSDSREEGNDDYSFSQTNVVSEVHVDVVMVGFPSSAIDAIRDRWFDGLGREDDLMAMLGPFSDVLPVLGDAKNNVHFHLVKTSFQVADALRQRVETIQKVFETELISTWEMDEVLSELAGVVASTHVETLVNLGFEGMVTSPPIKPAATIFVLNINTTTPYEYMSGLTDGEVLAASQDADIIKLCREKLSKIQRKSKVISPADETADREFPLKYAKVQEFNDRLTYLMDLEEKSAPRSSNSSRIHWRDAVTETRLWAKTIMDKTSAMVPAESSKNVKKDRVLRVLNAPTDSYLAKFSESLAAQVLEMQLSIGSKLTFKKRCFGPVHASLGKFLWMDINIHSDPPVHAVHGLATAVPIPRSVSEHEWLVLGDSDKKIDFHKQFKILKSSINRIISYTEHSFSEHGCPEDILSEPAMYNEGESRVEVLNSVASYFMRGYHYGYTHDNCATLIFELKFLNLTLEVTNDILGKLNTSTVTESSDANYFINDASRLLFRGLVEVIDVMGAYNMEEGSKTKSFAMSISSEEAVVYLGYITSAILASVRYLIAPPTQLEFPRDVKINRIMSPSLRKALGAMHLSEDIESVESWGNMEFNETKPSEASKSVLEALRPNILKSFNEYSSSLTGDGIHSDTEGVLCSSNSIYSEEKNMLLWSSMHPSVITPARVDITLYIIQTHHNFHPLGDYVGDSNGFDFATFISEINRFKLSNQDMLVNVQLIDAFKEEAELTLALEQCMQYTVTDDPKHKKRVFMNAKCVHSNVVQYDKNFHSDSLHIPIFLISFDYNEPVYLNNFEQSSAVYDSVIAVQNSQVKIPTDLSCRDGDLFDNGRNPIDSVLRATVQVLGGLPASQVGHRGLATTDMNVDKLSKVANLISSLEGDIGVVREKKNYCHNAKFHGEHVWGADASHLLDWSTFLGDSVRFEVSRNVVPKFSDIDIDIVHRSRLLRALALAGEIAKYEASNIMELIYNYKETHGAHETSKVYFNVYVRQYINAVNELTKKTLQYMERENWAAAAAVANAALYAASHPQDYINFEQWKLEYIVAHTDTTIDDIDIERPFQTFVDKGPSILSRLWKYVSYVLIIGIPIAIVAYLVSFLQAKTPKRKANFRSI